MYYLYFLRSTIDDKIYIGITDNTKRRLYQHLNSSKRKKYFSARWINKTLKNNGEIKMSIILENLTVEEAIKNEIYYIKTYRELGFNLTNISEGGLGFSHKGIPHSEEHKRKLEKAQPHKNRIPKNDLYDLYVNKKLSKKSIANIYNCGTTSVHRRLIQYNIPIRKTQNYKMSKKLDNSEIIKLYTIDDLSIMKIAKKYNVGSTAIRNILINNNIKREIKTKIKCINKYDNDKLVGSYTLYNLCKELNKKEHSVYSYIKSHEKCWGFRWEIIYK